MDTTGGNNVSKQQPPRKTNQNIQVYVRVRPLNKREHFIRSSEVIDVVSPREIVTRHSFDSKLTKKFTFDRTFDTDSRQVEVYSTVVAPLIEEVLAGYNCTVFAYGQTGTGKTHTMVGNECAELKSSWEDDSDIGIIPRALCHLFDELRLMELEYTMRISYLELYNEELCDLLSTDDSTKIRIFDDTTKKGSVIIQGLEEIPVHSKDDVYKLLEKGKERRRTATTLMNAQSSRSHTVFSIVVHIRESGIDGEDMLKIGKLNLVDLAGSENVSKAGNEKGIRVRETVNINQSLLTLGRVITALVERTPHIPYRESKLTRLLQESLGGRTKTSIIATISPGHKDIEETLSTLEYAHRAKNIQNKPEINQKLTKKTVLKEYTEEIDKLKRDLLAARDKNGIYLAEETYAEMTLKMDSQNRELNEKVLLLKALKDELINKEKVFSEVSLNLVEKTEELKRTEKNLTQTKGSLLLTKKVLHTTKRRYKEKKVLLDSHVKTEQKLTTQATEILDAADKAASDTQQLHSTIERRKDVDQKIRTACESFTERMLDNFDMMDGNLSQFQEKHDSYEQMLHEEFSNCTVVRKRLYKNATENIDNIRKLCLETQAANSSVHEQFAQSISGLSEEHRNFVLQLFDNLRKREAANKAEIQANITELEANNEQQKSTIDALRENVEQILQRNTLAVDAHAQQMQQHLYKMSELSECNLNELLKLQTELDTENAAIAQEQTLIDEFVKNMQELKTQRMSRNGKMCELVTQLKCNRVENLAQVQQSHECANEFKKLRHADTDASMKHIEEQVAAAIQCVDQSFAKCSTLQVQLENLCQASSKEIDGLIASERTHCTLMQQTSADSEANVKSMRLENERQFIDCTALAQMAISEETERLAGQVAAAGVYAEELQSHLKQYASTYKSHLNTCNEDLKQFQKMELKTYSSTGLTPSKRDFIYPRLLASTSPHNVIVKRYRQENDWSDLDTTATIDEGSEGEEPNASSLQEFSETETLHNSTPKDVTSNSYQERSSASARTSNTLQLPQLAERGNSLSRCNTPRKTSPRRTSPRRPSPAVFIKENKENIA